MLQIACGEFRATYTKEGIQAWEEVRGASGQVQVFYLSYKMAPRDERAHALKIAKEYVETVSEWLESLSEVDRLEEISQKTALVKEEIESAVLQYERKASRRRVRVGRYIKEHKPVSSKSRQSAAQWRRDNREKASAQAKVQREVKAGRLIKPDKCERCDIGRVALQGHHTNYEKPLEVLWLCHSCHKLEHMQMKGAA